MTNGKKRQALSFQEAINMGEYKPDILSKYSEWEGLSPYSQLQYIKQGLDNRKKNLTLQMAELYNVLDFRMKPDLKDAIKNIHDHLNKIEDDREKYYSEYSYKL